MEKLMELSQAIQKYLPLGQQILDWLNEHPEASGHEKKTSSYLAELLKKYGYDVTHPYKRVKNSFLARHEDKHNKKPKIAILCEYDAVENIGHSCGHSASCAAGIVCALAIEESYDDLPFQIEIVGTPDEEIGGEKITMLQKGVFDSYEFAVLPQMYSKNQPVYRSLAASDLIIHFYGKQAHASVNPWEGVNALNGVQLFFHAIDMMRAHMEKGDQVHGIIKEGGEIPNIIPRRATAYVYLRAYSYDKLLKLKERVENCARGAAIATENKYDTEQLNPTYAEIFAGDTAKHIVCDVMDEYGMPWEEELYPSGSSDVGNVDMCIPVFYPMISIGEEVPLYSEEFSECMKGAPGTFGMKNGAMVIAGIIEKLALNPQLLDKVKNEHAEYRRI